MSFTTAVPAQTQSHSGDHQPATFNEKVNPAVFVASSNRTLEQRIKFDAGLTVDKQHLVEFTLGEHKRRAIVIVTNRGVVKYLAMPHKGQMYSSWQRVKGNNCASIGGVFVWPGRDPEHMHLFEGEVVASIPCPTDA